MKYYELLPGYQAALTKCHKTPMNYLSAKQVAARLNVSVSAVWWFVKHDPTFAPRYRFGKQTVRWSLDQVEAWEESRRIPANSVAQVRETV